MPSDPIDQVRDRPVLLQRWIRRLYMPTLIAGQKLSSSTKALFSKRFLLVIDGTSASERAANYVADVIGGRRGFRVILAALLPPLPAQLLEFGGAENPNTEKKLEKELKHEQRRFIEQAKQRARMTLVRTRSRLREAGVVSNSLLIRFSDPLRQHSAAEELMEMARRYRCRTIVLGHRTHSWLRELVQRDLAVQVVGRGEGFS